LLYYEFKLLFHIITTLSLPPDQKNYPYGEKFTALAE